MGYFIGLDLGGTAIKGGLLDAEGSIVFDTSIDTEASGGAGHVVDRLAMLAKQISEQSGVGFEQIQAVGVGTPGPVDPKTQILLEAPNLGWKNFPLHAELGKRIERPVVVVNDANAACYGEFLVGVGRRVDVTHMVLLTLGTGIGGGIVMDRKLFTGPHGAGAELGHTIVTMNGRLCGCGQLGCVEQYASASAVARRAAEGVAAAELPTGMGPSPGAFEVFEAAAKGDRLAEAVVDEACEHLAVAIVSIAHALDPQVVALGGGMSAAGEPLVERVRAFFKKHNWKAAPPLVSIELATAGNRAGLIGAAGLAKEAMG